MDTFTSVIVYLLTWWVTLFAVLPWGVRTIEEPERGHAPSAPANPRIGTKLIATTVVAGIIWLIIYIVIASEVISFRAMVADT